MNRPVNVIVEDETAGFRVLLRGASRDEAEGYAKQYADRHGMTVMTDRDGDFVVMTADGGD